MSTYPRSTLKSADVCNFAIHALDTLPLTMPRAIRSRVLFQRLGLCHCCQALGPSRLPAAGTCALGPTVLGTLAQQLSDLDGLEGRANDLLARLLPKGLGKRGRCMAIDLIALPYHGTVEETHHDEVSAAKPNVARPIFSPLPPRMPWCGAAAIPWRCVACGPSRPWITWFRPSLSALVMLGIRLKLLLLDRGFYRVRVMRDLIMGELPFIMPAVKRGKKPTTPGGPTGTYALAAAKESQWTSYTLKSPQEGQVDFDLAVVCHNTRGRGGVTSAKPCCMPPGASNIAPGVGFAPPIGGVLVRVVLPAGASSTHPHQEPQPGLAAVVCRRGVGVAQCVGLVACGSPGGAAAWSPATASGIAAVCSPVAMAADGSRSPLSTLTEHPCLS